MTREQVDTKRGRQRNKVTQIQIGGEQDDTGTVRQKKVTQKQGKKETR